MVNEKNPSPWCCFELTVSFMQMRSPPACDRMRGYKHVVKLFHEEVMLDKRPSFPCIV